MSKTTWICPSNIALVKYWGKHGNQLPENPSISFTLSECYTETTVDFNTQPGINEFEFRFRFNGEPKPSFEPKIEAFLKKIVGRFVSLSIMRMDIDSTNTFPHSSGIASSASGMAALASCITTMEKQIMPGFSKEQYLQMASIAARLGSGSACRSIYDYMAVWGKSEFFEGSSDEYAIPYSGFAPIFKDYCDTILIVDAGEKEVSSTAGHALLKNHPFAPTRYEEARKNMGLIKKALETADLELFTEIVEAEAFMLHALMMTSKPPYLLMKAGTLNIINEVRAQRKSLGLNMCITLDAGANVHLLYPKSEAEKTRAFIDSVLKQYCAGGRYIHDHVGVGAREIQI